MDLGRGNSELLSERIVQAYTHVYEPYCAKSDRTAVYIFFRITEIRRVFSKKTIAIQFYLDTTIVFFVRTDSEALAQGRRDKVARAIKTRLLESSVF